MKRTSKIIAAVLLSATLLALLLLTGCVEKPGTDLTDGDWEGKEDFIPSDRYTESVKALEERYDEYLDNVMHGLAQTEPTSEELFETENLSDGIKITAYIGEDSIVIIPESIGGKRVIEIGEAAFASKKIRAVSVPDCVERIGKGAFEKCDELSTLCLPFVGDGGEITHFGYIFGADAYENHPLKVPASLDTVILNGNFDEISENAFAGCKSLSAVSIPDTVEKIGRFAFYECLDLVYFDHDNLVKTVGEYAFGHCSALFAADLENAENIGMGAFFGCNSMRELSLPFVGENNEKNRFLGYIFGAEIADYNDEFVPASLYRVEISQCDAIPDRAFASCKFIGEFILGDGINSIGARAFYACRSIKSLSLPDSVKEIEADAFFGCDNLEEIELGANVEKIGMQAFFGCRMLKSIELPYKVTEIKQSTFALCESLEIVVLNNVKKVGREAFRGCDSLIPVDCDGIDVSDGNSALILITEEE